MATLLAKLDNQNGFLDRFIISIPKPFRPFPEDQLTAKNDLKHYNFGMEDLLNDLTSMLDRDNEKIFYLENDATRLFNSMEYEYLNDLNENIQCGKPTVTSKKCDIIPKVEVAIHVMENLFKKQKGVIQTLPEAISSETIKKSNELC